MGKHGPCCHCGVTSTPLWRNGPPDKPVLCNACGSRWRTKGTLTNYTPLHARDPFEVEESKSAKERKISIKLREKLPKFDWDTDSVEEEPEFGDHIWSRKVGDEDMSNWSSSGSAVSYSESCAHFSGADMSDNTGSFQSNIWDSIVPSRKRTGVTRPKPSSAEKLTMNLHCRQKSSSVEKLTKDLHSILHQELSYLCASSEDDLLYGSGTPMDSIEIGHGGMLIKHPNLTNIEEESEASSLPIENKVLVCTGLPVPAHSQGLSCPNIVNGKLKGTQVTMEKPRRDKFSRGRINILQDRNSPLGFIDLIDVVSFEAFTTLLTSEEQLQLIKDLPSVDVSMHLESLKCMFMSSHFWEALSFFQWLLREGVFDPTSSQIKAEDCRNLQSMALSSLVKSTLIEQYYDFVKRRKNHQSVHEKEVASGVKSIGCSTTSHLKRPHEKIQSTHGDVFPEATIIVKSPRRLCISWNRDQLPMRNLQRDLNRVGGRSSIASNDSMDRDSFPCSPRSLFASQFHRGGILDSLQFSDASQDQELLLDVRSNTSFPEAELLSESWVQKTIPNNFCTPRGNSEEENNLSSQSVMTSSSNQLKNDIS